ncbi:hypothetical protein [Saccharomonospora viridis]|jgi:hypothetical protein|uniref:YtxH domain-containing protein n=2 Tax=Saccharomonospora viridis TaxID=1852 RepID=C7MQD1_SACVD|nr:hypothetical protein [Saccharomonospora viridis]ACU96430.1 hypothetical protein Svir_13830 [Saccharomonospora viridis DSM 43017]KHF42567.1 hypothetical protein MINT15_27690 [Saccharomonospora viridis]SFO96546.1 hypothetical protein SAMN02982918_0991 [Saccharomonospora viridis]
MKMFLLGAATGYVLGARAGRARYEQIVRTYRKFADHPAVQGAAGVVRAKIGEKIGERLPAGSRRSGSAHSPDGQVSSASRRSGLS